MKTVQFRQKIADIDLVKNENFRYFIEIILHSTNLVTADAPSSETLPKSPKDQCQIKIMTKGFMQF